jgi:hypothetical protein
MSHSRCIRFVSTGGGPGSCASRLWAGEADDAFGRSAAVGERDPARAPAESSEATSGGGMTPGLQTIMLGGFDRSAPEA